MNQIVINGKCTNIFALENNGKKIVNLGVVVQRNYKEQDGNIGADFFNVTIFGKKAEFIEKYFQKNRMVSVLGEFQNYKYVKDDITYYGSKIIAEEINYTDWKTINEADPSTKTTSKKSTCKATT